MPMKAPYRSIPISAFVHEPDWKAEVSIDAPLKDGVSGWLDITLTAKSELLVGGHREKRVDGTHVYFNETPDGRRAIPGSSVRGMLRSVLEIAAFGRAAFIDNARFGVRDLTTGGQRVYLRRLVESCGAGPIQGLPASRPRSRAGWLKRIRDPETGLDQWVLQSCEFARVAVTELERLQPGIEGQLRPRTGMAERYASWRKPTTQTLVVSGQAFHPGGWRRKGQGTPYAPKVEVEYAEAFAPAETDVGLKGEIVFTGKPAAGLHRRPDALDQQGQYYGKKKHEFFFHSRAPDWIDVTELKADFLDVHDERPGKSASESWVHWQPNFDRGDEIPVFFITSPGGTKVEAMGLAMMFKLAHRLRTRDLLAHASPDHLNLAIRDIPALLFGPALEAQSEAFKGRVSCETFLVQGTARDAPARTAILASPKGQFFQALVGQPTNGQGQLSGPDYASYSPLEIGLVEVRRPEVSGRKRYPSRSAIGGTELVAGADMRTILHAVAPGAQFSGRIRFHNLKPEELGALHFSLHLWAADWGAQPDDLRHRLGMGKSLGLGDVSLRVTNARIEPNELVAGGRNIILGDDALKEVERCSSAFAAHMMSAFDAAKKPDSKATWNTSEQIELLLAMADPEAGDNVDLTYMSLDEHRIAKGGGQVLPPYPRRSATVSGDNPGRLADRQVFSRDES